MTMAVDGFAGGQGFAGASLSATLTTTTDNDIIVVVVSAENRPAGTMPVLGSLTASGLTFNRRAQFTSTYDLMEVWWAYAALPLSATVITASVSNYDDATIVAFGVSGTGYLGSGNPFNSSSTTFVQDGTGNAPFFSTDASQNSPFVFAVWSRSLNTTPSGQEPAWLTSITNVLNSGGTDWEYTYTAGGVPAGALSATAVGWSSSVGSPFPVVMVDALIGVPAANPVIRTERLFRKAPGRQPPFGNPRALMGITEPYPLLVQAVSAFTDGFVRMVPDVTVNAISSVTEGYALPEQLYSIYVLPSLEQGYAVLRPPIQIQAGPAFTQGFGTVPGFTPKAVVPFVQGFAAPAHVPFWTVQGIAALTGGYALSAAFSTHSVQAFGQGFASPATLVLWPLAGTTGTGSSGGITVQNGGGTIKIPSWKWQLVDPTGLLSPYNWEINPNQGTFPNLQKQIQMTPTTAPDGPVLLFEGRQQVPVSTISGTFLSENQFLQLVQWFTLRRPVYVIDDLANRWTVYITNFQPGRKLSRTYPWKINYTIQWTVLDVLYSNNPGPGFSFAGSG